MNEIIILGGLGLIMSLVLILPMSVRWIEEELEAFLLVMGILAVSLARLWDWHLIKESLTEPVKISIAVLLFGFPFRWMRHRIHDYVSGLARRLGLRLFLFILVIGLGFVSSAITAIIAALFLVEVVSVLQMEKSKERALVILACYSIGLGAVLTPVGEPLSTIATAKLAGPPHDADFFFLARLLWPWVTAGIALLALLAAGYVGPSVKLSESLTQDKPEDNRAIVLRAGKVYVFVAALVLLGRGFAPLVDRYLLQLTAPVLYWVNMISAVLDNATLAAAEISPKMSLATIEYLLLGLLVSGGMLIPGNIPNIIAANKLGIQSRDWAKLAVPLGLVLMAFYFIFLQMAQRLGI